MNKLAALKVSEEDEVSDLAMLEGHGRSAAVALEAQTRRIIARWIGDVGGWHANDRNDFAHETKWLSSELEHEHKRDPTHCKSM